MKGKTNNPNGRPKGSSNRATNQAREAIAMFVENNVERLCGWLDEIAEDNPKAAFDSFMSVVEYHIPKLSRADNNHSGKIETKITSDITVTNQILKVIPQQELEAILARTQDNN